MMAKNEDKKKEKGIYLLLLLILNMLFRVVLDDIYIRVFVEIDDLLL